MTEEQRHVVLAPSPGDCKAVAFCPSHWAVPGHCGPHLTDGEAGGQGGFLTS